MPLIEWRCAVCCVVKEKLQRSIDRLARSVSTPECCRVPMERVMSVPASRRDGLLSFDHP